MAHKESARVWVMFFFSLIIQMTRRSSLYFTKKKRVILNLFCLVA